MVRTGIPPEKVNLVRCVNNHTSEISFRTSHSGRCTLHRCRGRAAADDIRRNIIKYDITRRDSHCGIHLQFYTDVGTRGRLELGDLRYFIIMILGMSSPDCGGARGTCSSLLSTANISFFLSVQSSSVYIQAQQLLSINR